MLNIAIVLCYEYSITVTTKSHTTTYQYIDDIVVSCDVWTVGINGGTDRDAERY